MKDFINRLKGRFTKINDLGKDPSNSPDEAAKFGRDFKPVEEYIEQDPNWRANPAPPASPPRNENKGR